MARFCFDIESSGPDLWIEANHLDTFTMPDGREQMDRLLKQIEQEAYARGWADAIAALQAKAAELPKPESVPDKGVAADKQSNGTRARGRPATAIGLVRSAISEKPGMTGAQIVVFLEQRQTPVKERTVRSCLRRLKGRDADKRRLRWYPRLAVENLNGEVLGTPPH